MQREGREKPINEINPRTLSVSLREACFIANFHRAGWRTFCFMKLPFLQFYPADYLVDTRVLTLSARGAWVDILCVLHASSTRGTSTLPVRGWARIMGVSDADFEIALGEIEAMKVGNVTRCGNGDVTITCRRMTNEAITREQSRLRVQNHRNKERNAARNASGNANVTPNKLEVISHKLETEAKNTEAPVPVAVSSVADQQSRPAPKFDPATVDFPANLNSARMRVAWTQWCIYRKERKQPMTAQTVKLQLAAMSKWGEPYTISAIEKSIMNSWRGVFGPEDGAGNQRKPAQESEFASAF